jgi:hypothetical protein
MVGRGRQLIGWRAAPYPMVTARWIGKIGCLAHLPTLVRDVGHGRQPGPVERGGGVRLIL